VSQARRARADPAAFALFNGKPAGFFKFVTAAELCGRAPPSGLNEI